MSKGRSTSTTINGELSKDFFQNHRRLLHTNDSIWTVESPWPTLDQKWISPGLFEAVATMCPELREAAEAAQDGDAYKRENVRNAINKAFMEYVKLVRRKEQSITDILIDYFIEKSRNKEEWDKDIKDIQTMNKEPDAAEHSERFYKGA